MSEWPLAFALTQAIELPIYALGLRGAWYRRLLLGFLASALTHPWVWFVAPIYVAPVLGLAGYLVVAEVGAWLAEAGLLAACGQPRRRALAVALAANGASFVAGEVLRGLGVEV